MEDKAMKFTPSHAEIIGRFNHQPLEKDVIDKALKTFRNLKEVSIEDAPAGSTTRGRATASGKIIIHNQEVGTFLHEIAHVMYGGFNHGAGWKRNLRKLRDWYETHFGYKHLNDTGSYFTRA